MMALYSSPTSIYLVLHSSSEKRLIVLVFIWPNHQGKQQQEQGKTAEPRRGRGDEESGEEGEALPSS